MKKLNLFLIFIYVISCSTISHSRRIMTLSPEELLVKQEHDLKFFKIYRTGLNIIINYAYNRKDLFPQKKLDSARLISIDKRKQIRAIWKSLLDYYLAMDSIYAFHNEFSLLKGKYQHKSFYISYAAFLAEYRFALDFISLTENNPALDTILNEPVPELGLKKDIYKRFKFRFLNVKIATEFAAYNISAPLFKDPQDKIILTGIKNDKKRIWKMGKGKGELLTIKNGLKILKTGTMKLIFPVQKGISNWMGDTKIYRQHKYLINLDDIKKIKLQLQPGDILLERREWYLSNIGIPGFWTHAALYIGSSDQRNLFFSTPEVKNWLKRKGAENFEEYFLNKFPKAYKEANKKLESGYYPEIIEAIGEGVLFGAPEQAAICDSLAALRPRLTRLEIAKALLRAINYSGRPYDFNFDFLTDRKIVCSELIYKAYEPTRNYKGIKFPLETLLGRKLMSANTIAEIFDKNYQKPTQQMDFILFYDGFESDKMARPNSLKEFRKSWERPKWHILTQ